MRLDHLLSKDRSKGCISVESLRDSKFPVMMRSGVTPVLIPNTTVKTQAAEGTMLETIWENRWSPDQWGYSSVGRAPALQAGGQGFESLYLHGSRNASRFVP